MTLIKTVEAGDVQKAVDLLNGSAAADSRASSVSVCPECYAQRDEVNPVLNVTWSLRASAFYTDAATGEKLRPAGENIALDRCLVCDWSQVKREVTR